MDNTNNLTETKMNSLSVWEEMLSIKNHYQFFFYAVLKTIDAFRNGEFSKFDAQTNTTCCHGVAVLANELILQAHGLDLGMVKQKITLFLLRLENNEDLEDAALFIKNIPYQIVDLTSLFVLCYASDIEKEKGRYTSRNKLKEIFNTNYKFRDQVVKTFQRYVSNAVSGIYSVLLNRIDPEAIVNGCKTVVWGKYVEETHIRIDVRKVRFVPYVYSMQVLISYLITNKKKIAVVHDVIDGETHLSRKTWVLKGDGKQEFEVIEDREMDNMEPSDLFENLIVFSGFSFKGEKEVSSSWIHNLTKVLLACDVQCPQFPKVSIDPNFNSNPITPEESQLTEILGEHKKMEGYAITNPSLFCLIHVSPASMQEVIKGNFPCIPLYIPKKLYVSALPIT